MTESQERNTIRLRVGMTGKASDAKTADGDAPVFAYIASLRRNRSAASPRRSMHSPPGRRPVCDAP